MKWPKILLRPSLSAGFFFLRNWFQQTFCHFLNRVQLVRMQCFLSPKPIAVPVWYTVSSWLEEKRRILKGISVKWNANSFVKDLNLRLRSISYNDNRYATCLFFPVNSCLYFVKMSCYSSSFFFSFVFFMIWLFSTSSFTKLCLVGYTIQMFE